MKLDKKVESLELQVKALEKKFSIKKLAEMENKVKVLDDVLTKAKARFKSFQTLHAKEKASLIRLINDADKLFVKDLTSRYGFTEDHKYMYYIGAGSGRIFRAKANDEIIELIQNIENLDWRDILKINQYFINNNNN